MTSAFKGNFLFKIADGASPQVFTTLPETFSISGLGKTNELIDVTNLDSGNTREFIAGLADGEEITIEANYLPDDTEQVAARALVDNGTNRNVQVIATNGANIETFDFLATFLSWVINPAVDDKNTLTITVKISGDITLS